MLSDNADPKRYDQDSINPMTEGIKPSGKVVNGNDRKPPPIVVPAINAALDNTDDVVDVDDDDDDDDNDDKTIECLDILDLHKFDDNKPLHITTLIKTNKTNNIITFLS